MPSKTKILEKPEKCEVCDCTTNAERLVWGIGGGGRFLICPGKKKYEELHDELEEKVERFYEGGHPKIYIEALKKEIAAMRKKFKNIPPYLKKR